MKPLPADDSSALRLALALLLFVAGLSVVGWAALAIDAPVGRGVVAIAAVGAALAAGRRSAVIAGAFALIGTSLVLAAFVHDVSWDGQAYHQVAVLALHKGWNPLRDGPLPLAGHPDHLWVNHYPKASWIAEAATLSLTCSLEATKGLALVLAQSSALFVYTALRRLGRTRAVAAGIAAVAAANPVVLAQLCTFYIDGWVAALLTILAASLGLMRAGAGKRPLLAIAAALAVLVNLKFTGFVYAGLFFVAGLGVLARPARRRFAFTSAAALGMAVFALGFDPYITNTVRRGHPFFPLRGEGAVDILTPHVDPTFHDAPRPMRLARSLFSRSSNLNQPPSLKSPLAISSAEIEAFGFADTRIGGFGPLFAAGALATAALFVWLARRRALERLTGLAAATLLASAFVNPGLWWARYVPQLWLVPVGALVAATAPGIQGGRCLTALRAALALVLAVDVALVAAGAMSGQARATRQVNAQLARLSGESAVSVSFHGFDANAARLLAHGIRFEPHADLTCQRRERIVASLAEVCVRSNKEASR